MQRSDFCHLKLDLVSVLASGLRTKPKIFLMMTKKDDADEHSGMFVEGRQTNFRSTR